MKKLLSIDEITARQLYPQATGVLKTLLEEAFGKGFFDQKITDRVKSFEDACAVLGVSPDSVVFASDTVDEEAYKKLKVIVRALNEGWAPDWDHPELIYYPVFYFSSLAFRFDRVAEHCRYSPFSSHLVFRSPELAKYAAHQFADLYFAYMLA